MATTSYPRARAGRNLLTVLKDEAGSASTDYVLLFAALALGMLAAVVTSDLVGGMLAEAVERSLQDTSTGRYPGSDYDWAVTPGGEA